MISYVKLKNFISFGDICFDFRKTKSQVKNFAAIYGENGSGKTNFITSIRFLIHSMSSFTAVRFMQTLQEKIDAGEIDEEMRSIIATANRPGLLQEFTEFMKRCRTINCDAPTEVEYGFRYNDHDGIYRITFTDRIIKESLRYWTGKLTTQMFSIEMHDNTIKATLSPKIFKASRVRQDITEDVEKYWGKHTLLGIISNQMRIQNENYTQENYSSFLNDVIDCFHTLYVLTKAKSSTDVLIPQTNKYVLTRVKAGTINSEELPVLKRTEDILNCILTQTYADIKEVKYQTKKAKETIKYNLLLKKMIAGQIREIDIEKESFGTIQILDIISPLMASLAGMTVFIDEADTGIHDILFRNIIESIKDDIAGQLILTTHNTTLLEKIDSQNAYIIYVDYEGNKEAVCFDEYDVQKTNNARSLYLKGVFGGIPVAEPFDDSTILSELQQSSGLVKTGKDGGSGNGS